ncbi:MULTISPECIES: DUF1328 domain-containing protein [Phaeobacter]|uniref:Small integral membrane protein n=1 Tax=Phaeobacter piscinae TaxID=1580596 RepID=A0ABM6P9P1_9RHOB|nr:MULTISPECIES: DUF1328 domain-containing protein [Phaeobacter]ATG34330.1 hypothetical protein PhaeoP36_00157 [Phaeobacter piscinae]ATG38288.1 hypothetical protein PhaeoP14_00155 [Phaeobacter piscinae]AUQ84850.1 hypothetical protein PhaeoP42_00157 [Phaeobacter piscinae]AUR22733.1 hypothetical protein PhaeoP23_00156 [Phaeobacter piscinae]UTS79133.1 hypothetical protein OL67_000178 [Phaeobacter piscinae]
MINWPLIFSLIAAASAVLAFGGIATGLALAANVVFLISMFLLGLALIDRTLCD